MSLRLTSYRWHQSVCSSRCRSSDWNIDWPRDFGRDVVMKLASHRDRIAAKENVIAFEMEGAIRCG
jgi:hypothetical protein